MSRRGSKNGPEEGAGPRFYCSLGFTDPFNYFREGSSHLGKKGKGSSQEAQVVTGGGGGRSVRGPFNSAYAGQTKAKQTSKSLESSSASTGTKGSPKRKEPSCVCGESIRLAEEMSRASVGAAEAEVANSEMSGTDVGETEGSNLWDSPLSVATSNFHADGG